MTTCEPVLNPIPIAELRPTQMTVGFREVAEKRREWRERAENSPKKAAKYLGSHTVPTVLGAGGRHYLIDHHHLVLALHEEKQTKVLVTVTADLSSLPRAAFWTYLDNRALCHPYDAAGKRRAFADIPKSITGLADDPYRSLSGELRRVDFLRPRVKARQIDDHFSAALEKALSLSKTEAASYLPGWCGPHAG
jgi:hypothetical protein